MNNRGLMSAGNKALFLDRDGVINIDKGYVHKIEDCEFVNGIFDICRLAREKGYLLIVVTNQSGIARGFYTEKDFLTLMEYIGSEFKKQGCPLDEIFYCPYHEDGKAPWNIKSPDRKPGPGMLYRAANKFSLDLRKCLMLGDQESDIMAGKNAGIIHSFRMDLPDDRERLLKFLHSQNNIINY